MFGGLSAPLVPALALQTGLGADPYVVLVFALVTLLGDPALLFAGLTLAYWLAPSRVALGDDVVRTRRALATVLALGVAALGTTIALKTALALPRPTTAVAAAPAGWPGPVRALYLDGTAADGFGFPSGHALGTAAAYGGMAALFDRWTRRRRAAVAGAVVALVALSRVVLGVHSPADVLAGVAVGLALVWVVVRVAAGRPDRAFAVAAVLAAAALVGALADPTDAYPGAEAAAGLGGAVGGVLAWRALGDAPAARVSVPAALAGLVVAGGTFAAYTLPVPLAAVLVADGVAVATVLALPAVLERAGVATGTDVTD